MLVRKSIGEHVSVSANYYVDMVSSASIDVETSASPYERRAHAVEPLGRLPARQVHLHASAT